ncbi:hypothetical protein D3C75_1203500 [compost metagenome]
MNLSNQRQILRCNIIHGSNELLGNDQHMNRSGRLNIVKSENPFIFEDLLGWDRTLNNFAKYGFHGNASSY